MTKLSFEKFAIFKLKAWRAVKVLDTMDMLQEIGRLDMKNARKNGITDDEWHKTQHFYLSSASKNLENIKTALHTVDLRK